MVAAHLSLTEERSQERLVLRVRGEVDASTAPFFATGLSRAAGAGNPRLVVDLTRMEFIDVKGFAALLNAHRKVRDAHGEMSVVCRAGQVRRVLSLLDTSGRLRLSS